MQITGTRMLVVRLEQDAVSVLAHDPATPTYRVPKHLAHVELEGPGEERLILLVPGESAPRLGEAYTLALTPA